MRVAPRVGKTWASVTSLALLRLASACAPAGQAEGFGTGAEDGDAGAGVLEEKAFSTLRYQAESRTADGDCSLQTRHSGYDGSGYMDFGNNGSWVEWSNVSASLSGTYRLSFRYANGGGSGRGVTVSVNGASAATTTLASTTAWTQWSTATVTVSLRQGSNTVRVLANTSAGGPNLDYMDVTATDLCPSDPNKVEPGLCGCGTAEGSCSGGGGGGDVGNGVTIGRASGAKLRVASWNTMRGSVFPKTDSLWRAVNTAGTYQEMRTTDAARIFKGVNADIWLLQETCYSSDGLPSGVTTSQVSTKIRDYMAQITGDNSWQVSCNGLGLCAMIRGAITLRSVCSKNRRANGYLVELRNYGNASMLLSNVHYMDTDQATYTKAMLSGSSAAAKFVAGDFNDGTGGARYSAVASTPGLSVIDISQPFDPKARHLSSRMVAQGWPKNSKGYTTLGASGIAGEGAVTAEGGGLIDHFFLGSTANAWMVKNRYILNTFLLSNDTLAKFGMQPYDAALSPESIAPYFADFMRTGKMSAVSSNIVVDHDHLPMVVDFDFTTQSAGITPNLYCP